MNTLITITNLNVKIDSKNIIDNLNLEIYEKEILTIVGKSGTGKSTFLKCILNLIDYNGDINLGNNIISYMPQDLALFEYKTVYDNVILPFKVKNIDIVEEKVDIILKDLEILDLKSKRVKELSGGEQSRVALARALILENKILLLDEPLAKLDYLTKYNILKVLKGLKEKYKVTLVYVTHDIEEVIYISDRILLLNGINKVMRNVDLKSEDLIKELINEENKN